MKKTTMIISLIALVGVLALGSISPSQSWATNDSLPQLSSPDDSDGFDDLIFEQNEGSNDGSDGDPDSAGDGFGFMGQGLFEDVDWTYEEIMEWILAQLIPAPE